MDKCINTKHPEFIELAKQANINPLILKSKVGVWQEKNNSDDFPTLQELGLGQEAPDYLKLQNIEVDFDNVDTALDDKLKLLYKELYEDIEVLFLDREITRIDFPPTALLQLSNKLRNEFIDKLKKKRPDLEEKNLTEKVISSIEEFAETNSKNDSKLEVKLQKLAFHWTLNGQVILPEDGVKILQAIKISKIKGIDLFTFNSPNEVISQYSEIKEDVPLIDPDTIKEFKNKRDIGNGITWYEVDNTEEGRVAARRIIDTHFGENDNPWCLLAKDNNGSIENTSTFWFNNYPGEKRIAFQNGKLIAFYGGEQWWDRLDNPSIDIPITKRGNFIDDGKGRVRHTVIVDENDSNIDIEHRGYERGDKKNGLYEKWDLNKILIQSTEYKDRKKHGKEISYYENGDKTYEIDYKDGNKHGKEIWYYENGNIKRETDYKDGELEGKYIGYYENGNILSEITYKDGKLDGKHIYYYTNGNIEYERTYKDGKLEGKYIKYYDNGNIEYETDYKDGVLHGIHIEYYKNGNIQRETEYKDGELNGKDIKYYDNGNKEYEVGYKNNKLHGEDIKYYDNYRILGVADIDNSRILIDDINKKQDTLSHEYAHHYIRMFIDTPIVQEAIKKWGSEEALVQAIGEQAVKQKGEAYNWWKKFSRWIKSIFNNLDLATKEELLAVLTEGFLTNQNLESDNKTKEGVAELFESNPELANAVYEALGFNTINGSEITYTDEEGNPCAKMGLTNTVKGTNWKIVKDFKGKPKHSNGGVDITISDKGVSMRRGGRDIKAQYGLLIPA